MLAIFGLHFLYNTQLPAATIHVPADFATIQAALDASATGDTIEIEPEGGNRYGDYQENLVFPGHDVRLISAPSSPRRAVIDGNYRGPVILLLGNETPAALIEGVYLKNGSNKEPGGGIEGNGSRITIRDCSIQNNESFESGGGIAEVHGLIEECNISSNRAVYRGGGLFHCNGRIQRNTFSSNEVYMSEPSAGGSALAKCSSLIINNLIYENECTGARGGTFQGGAVLADGGQFINNTITGNTSVSPAAGIYLQSAALLRNNLIHGNTSSAASASGTAIQVYFASSDEGTIEYNLIENWQADEHGNFTAYPGSPLVTKLLPGSPCIDAGVKDDRVTLDRSGAPRPVLTKPWDLKGDGSGMDIGAYEYQEAVPPHNGPLRVPGDFDSIQSALDAAYSGDEIVVEPGTYEENISFPGFDITLRCTYPRHWDIVQQTIIKGNGARSTVSFQGSESVACVIEGFTITMQTPQVDLYGNLLIGSGGGVNGHRARCTVRNNIITKNAAASGGGIVNVWGRIEGNRITSNVAQHAGAGVEYCGGELIGNLIQENSVQARRINDSYFYGGGIDEFYGRIANNLIVSNRCMPGSYMDGGHGGGAYVWDCIVENNLFSNNSAHYYGGLSAGGDSIVRNNILIQNSDSPLYPGTGAPGTAQLATDDGVPVEYNLIQDWTNGGVGNLAGSPKFDPASQYHLAADSPCIDAGGFVDDLPLDFEANPRPVAVYPPGNRGDGSGFDIGPFEYQLFKPSGLVTLTESGDAWGVIRRAGDAVDPEPRRLDWLGFRYDLAAQDVTLAGDYSGDGMIDFVTVTATGELWLAENDGLGNFAHRAPVSSGLVCSEPSDAPGLMMFFGNVESDWRDSLVAVLPDGTAQIAISQGRFFAPFQPAGNPNVHWHPSNGVWVGLGDVNADDRPDLVQLDSKSGKVSVALLDESTNEFQSSIPWKTTGFRFNRQEGYGVHLADVNGDRMTDLVQITPNGEVLVARSKGTSFGTPATFGFTGFHDEPERGHGWNVFVADMNGDGKDDLVQLTEFGDWWQSLSTGTSFGSPQHLGWTGFQHQPTGKWQAWVGRWRR